MADHKNKKQNETVDAGLCGNEKIEEAIAALQQEPTQEMLAHTQIGRASCRERV